MQRHLQVVKLRQRQTQQSNAFDQFCRQHALVFDGKVNEVDANNWIERLEKIFNVVSRTKQQKVEFTTYNLLDMANGWWKFTRGLIQ